MAHWMDQMRGKTWKCLQIWSHPANTVLVSQKSKWSRSHFLLCKVLRHCVHLMELSFQLHVAAHLASFNGTSPLISIFKMCDSTEIYFTGIWLGKMDRKAEWTKELDGLGSYLPLYDIRFVKRMIVDALTILKLKIRSAVTWESCSLSRCWTYSLRFSVIRVRAWLHPTLTGSSSGDLGSGWTTSISSWRLRPQKNVFPYAKQTGS